MCDALSLLLVLRQHHPTWAKGSAAESWLGLCWIHEHRDAVRIEMEGTRSRHNSTNSSKIDNKIYLQFANGIVILEISAHVADFKARGTAKAIVSFVVILKHIFQLCMFGGGGKQ